jgi:hypothetical protein
MNHSQILRRAWNILWSYRAIWFFGILLSLTTASGANSGSRWNANSGSSRPGSAITLPPEIARAFENIQQTLTQFFNGPFQQNLIALIVGLTCFFLLLAVVFTIVHNVSQVALIRMVDQYEATGEKAGVRQGFHLGWSRAAWRIFLIDLVVSLPVVAVFIVLFGCAAVPVLLSSAINHQPGVPGIIATVGLVFLLIFLAILVFAFLSLLLEPIRRVCALEGAGVFASIRAGWQMLRRNLWNVFLMWLILVGIQIAYAILLIPIGLLLLLAGGLSGGGVGAGLFFLIRALGNESTAWITGIGLGILLFILVLALPLLFIGGLKESYLSTAWTLAYRQIRPLAFDAPLPPTPENPPETPLPSAG